MRRVDGGVQFDGFAGAAWRFETESAASVEDGSGFIAGATAATRTAGWYAGGSGVGGQRGRRGSGTAHPKKGSSTTVTSSARTGRVAWGITLPES
jgi:hypothetical protein